MKTILLSLIIALSLTNIISCKKSVTVTDPPLFDFKLSDLVGKWEGRATVKRPGVDWSFPLLLDVQSANKILVINTEQEEKKSSWSLEGASFVGNFSRNQGKDAEGDYIIKAPFRKDSLIGSIFLLPDLVFNGTFALGRKK